jgi:ribose transport system substrate-binding protein
LKNLKRITALFLSALMMLVIFSGCSSTSSSSSDKSGAPPKKKIGVIIWSTSDSLGAATKRTLDHAGKALNIELSYKTGDYDTQSQVNAAQNFIASGVDGILAVPLLDDATPKIGKLAKDAKIPFMLMYRKIVDNKIAAQMEKNPYYLGNTVEDEETAGAQLLKTLTDGGAKNTGAIYFAPGITVVDRRHTGIEQGYKDTSGVKKVGEAVLSGSPNTNDFVEATNNFITTYKNLDGIILASGANGGIDAAIATVQKNNAAGKVKLASFDQPSNMSEGFEKNILAGVAAGTFDDPLFSFIVMANYLQGNPLSDKPVALNANYIYVKNLQDAEDFKKYIDNKDAYIYSQDEIKKMTKFYNHSFTLDDLKKIVASYSLEDVKTRMAK